MKTYKTSDIARAFDLHANTIRLYEELGFISKTQRRNNGYRIFTDVHMEQMKLVRLALKSEVLQNGLRKEALNIIKTSAVGNHSKAVALTHQYVRKISQEIYFAEDAIKIVENLFKKSSITHPPLQLTRKQAADYLQISIDTLRNWEMNGLVTVKRKENGYRIYKNDDITRLKIIRSLRCANYSLTSILRLLNDLSASSPVNIKDSINTPKDSEDIISVCDRLLTSLESTKQDANQMLKQLIYMQEKFANPPL